MRSIATIGCDGVSPERLEDVLTAARIDVVVDVRAGDGDSDGQMFSKALAARMRAADRAYVRLQDLACVGDLIHLTQSHRVALMGQVADARDCRRARIAEQVADLANLAILHLRAPENRHTRGASRPARSLELAAA